MRIDAAATATAGENWRAANLAPSPAGFSTAMAKAADAAEPKAASSAEVRVAQADFHNMTRKELGDWMNHKIRSGEMTLDESTPFLGLTMRMPVAASGNQASPLDDTERVDFTEILGGGIANAKLTNDFSLLASLETAIRIMQADASGGIDRTA